MLKTFYHFRSSFVVAWCLAMSDTCAICRDPMSEADDRLALQCGHVFHQHCIQSYADVKSMHILDLQCPNCKATSHDIRQREETLIVQSVGDETSDAAAGDMAATEATQTDQDTGDGYDHSAPQSSVGALAAVYSASRKSSAVACSAHRCLGLMQDITPSLKAEICPPLTVWRWIRICPPLIVNQSGCFLKAKRANSESL